MRLYFPTFNDNLMAMITIGLERVRTSIIKISNNIIRFKLLFFNYPFWELFTHKIMVGIIFHCGSYYLWTATNYFLKLLINVYNSKFYKGLDRITCMYYCNLFHYVNKSLDRTPLPLLGDKGYLHIN
jgi:hypothetical protein